MKTKHRAVDKAAKCRVIELVSRSPSETRRLGKRLASILTVPGVLLLRGSLGTGKTTFTRGVVEGLGSPGGSQVNSPSFTLVNIYHGRCPVYHVDLYRLSGPRDLRSIGLEEFLGSDGVTVIEWSERLGYWPDHAIRVELEDAGDDKRRIRMVLPPGIPGFPRSPARRSAVAGRVRKEQMRGRGQGE